MANENSADNVLDFAGLFDGHTHSEGRDAKNRELELVTNLKDWFTKAHEAKSSYENDWELFRLYLKGDQLVVRHRDTGEIVRLTSEDSKRLRSINNQLRPTTRSLVGKLSRSIPTCVAIPATNDVDEQHGSRVANAFMQMVRRKEKLDVKYLDLNNKLPWAGNAFMQLSWDPDAGNDIAYCLVCNFYDPNEGMIGKTCPRCEMQRQMEQAQQRMGEQEQIDVGTESIMQDRSEGIATEPEDLPAEMFGEVKMQQAGPLPLNQQPPQLVSVKEGDVKFHVRDPRNCYPDPGVNSIQDCRMFCFREIIRVSLARERFPQAAKFIKAESNLYTEQEAEIRFTGGDIYSDTEYLDDHVYVYEFHEAATPRYPDGRIIFMVNDMIVEQSSSPYSKFGRLPFFHFGFDKNDGEFWYEPFIAQAWHRQREININETNIREHIELLLKPKFFKAIGSRISADELTATTAQVVSYNAAAGRNYFEAPPPVPMDIFNRNALLSSEIRQQAGVTEQEAALGGDVSGRAMAILEAEADQQVGPILVRNHEEWRDMHRCMLVLVKDFYHAKRKLTIAGPDGLQTYSFEELNLAPGFDIQIEQEDGLSRNPAVRLNQAVELFQAGIFVDPTTGMPDIQAFMQHARINLPRAGFNKEASERAAASQIPFLIAKGQSYNPAPEDDPKIFAEELLGWLRGPGRRAEPRYREQVRQVWQYYAHWMLTGSPPPQGPPGGAPPPGPQGPGVQGGMSPPAGSVGMDARNRIQQADRSAENQAKIAPKHEG